MTRTLGNMLRPDAEPLPADEPPPLSPEACRLIAEHQRRWALTEIARAEHQRALHAAIADAQTREAVYQRHHRT